MSNPQVVIYGASGYTGKLIAWHLAEYGIPFIAAGRNQARIEEQMALVPELKNADYSCEEVAHDEEALARLFDCDGMLKLGYARRVDYARERLGLPPRTMYGWVRLARAVARWSSSQNTRTQSRPAFFAR